MLERGLTLSFFNILEPLVISLLRVILLAALNLRINSIDNLFEISPYLPQVLFICYFLITLAFFNILPKGIAKIIPATTCVILPGISPIESINA